jgi:hypothetical protein
MIGPPAGSACHLRVLRVSKAQKVLEFWKNIKDLAVCNPAYPAGSPPSTLVAPGNFLDAGRVEGNSDGARRRTFSQPARICSSDSR